MDRLRIATYNIHKGVQGLGPARRLEIHNIALAVERFDADIVCLQEVRHLHRRDEAYFAHWPRQPQADYLAPPGYRAVYRTNAVTRHGEHGNAILSRHEVESHAHEDMSDHRLEQRGLLHACVRCGGRPLHVIAVHLGLIASSRRRQVAQLSRFIGREVPASEPLVVAGDFNDWGARLRPAMASIGLHDLALPRTATFPARLPIAQLDFVYARGLKPLGLTVPRGPVWWRMSDHLPLIAEFGF